MISEKDCCPNELYIKVFMGLNVETQCNIGFQMKWNIEDLKNFNAIKFNSGISSHSPSATQSQAM